MMAEDGYRTLSPEAWTAKYKPAVDHPLEVSLANATNSLERQLTFVGDLKHIEFQALGVRRTLQDSYERARAIHVTVDSLRPVLESDNWIAHGVYILPAVLRSGVETKHAVPGTWFDIPKGGGTTDSDIESRRILAVDCDVVRSSGTSATEEEMIRSVHVALRIWNYLEGALVDSRAMAYIHSGNGRQIHLALDSLPNDEECKRFASGILIGLASLFDTPEVKVDRKLFDAKRILPACGTLKKKGAPGIPERPHRRTAIVTPETVRRLSKSSKNSLASSGTIPTTKGVKPSARLSVQHLRRCALYRYQPTHLSREPTQYRRQMLPCGSVSPTERPLPALVAERKAGSQYSTTASSVSTTVAQAREETVSAPTSIS